MRYRKLSSSGDYTFGNGLLDFYQDSPEAIGQAVQTALLFWQGEWFLNIDEGTPYMTQILGKRSKDEADRAIRNRVLSVTGVTDIASYASVLDPDSRKMAVTDLTINTVYGPTTVQIVNYVNF